ncbi:MAG TPA: RNA 2',3'-cyclic phosphodiesterase [Actinomycetota bacterium]|nr:RNA 2',3'-cyclic phosphodiesterase [Actinomycetota bacterium]
MTLRLFFAVEVPAELLELVRAKSAGLRSKWPEARWTTPENQHLTLKFLGATSSDDLDNLVQTGAAVARSHAAAEVALTELGAFPSARRARVLWLGISDPAGVLHGLAAGLSSACESLGYRPEARPYVPHLTLARFKTPVRLGSELTLELSEALFEVSEVGLWRSHLSPKGARYELLESLPLMPGRG